MKTWTVVLWSSEYGVEIVHLKGKLFQECITRYLMKGKRIQAVFEGKHKGLFWHSIK